MCESTTMLLLSLITSKCKYLTGEFCSILHWKPIGQCRLHWGAAWKSPLIPISGKPACTWAISRDLTRACSVYKVRLCLLFDLHVEGLHLLCDPNFTSQAKNMVSSYSLLSPLPTVTPIHRSDFGFSSWNFHVRRQGFSSIVLSRSQVIVAL